MKLGSSTPDSSEATSRHRHGLSPRGERVLDIAGIVVVALFLVGWAWSIAHAKSPLSAGGEVVPPTSTITAALTHADAPTTAYLTDAALNALVNRMLATARGKSGKLRVAIEPTPTPIHTDTTVSGRRASSTRKVDRRRPRHTARGYGTSCLPLATPFGRSRIST